MANCPNKETMAYCMGCMGTPQWYPVQQYQYSIRFLSHNSRQADSTVLPLSVLIERQLLIISTDQL